MAMGSARARRDAAAAAHIVHSEAQILQRDALGGQVEPAFEAEDRTAPSGSGSCWPSQAASSRGPARSILMLAVGGRCGRVHRPVEADRAAGDAEIDLDRAGLAGSHALRPGHGAGQGGTLAFHGDPAVELDRLVGTGLVDRQVDRFGAPVQLAGTVVEGDHATFDPNVAEDETGDRRVGRGLICCCFAVRAPLPKSQFRRPSSPTSRLSCGRVTISRSTLIRLSRQKARRSMRASSASTRANVVCLCPNRHWRPECRRR